MKNCSILLLFAISTNCLSQISFYNDGLNYQNTIADSYFINNDSTIILVSHFCNDNKSCFSFLNYNSNTNKVEFLNYERNVALANLAPLSINENRNVVLLQDNNKNYESIPIAILSDNYEIDSIVKIIPDSLFRYYTTGILYDNNSYVIWGQTSKNETIDYSMVFYLNVSSDLSEIISFETFGLGDSYNLPGRLKKLKENQYLIISEADYVDNELSDSTHLSLIDNQGKLVSNYSILRGPGNRSSLDFGINNAEQSIVETNVYNLRNKLTCYTNNSREVKWEYNYPLDQVNQWNRQYFTYDYIKSSNSSNLITGSVYDLEIDDKLILGGTILELDSIGSEKFLKRFFLQVDSPIASESQYDHLQFKKTYKLNSDSLLVLGESTSRSNHNRGLMNLVFLKLDSRGSFNSVVKDTFELNYYSNPTHINIGTSWNFEFIERTNNTISPKRIEIEDKVKYKGKWVYKLNSELFNHPEYLLDHDSCFYFWDEQLNDYQLQYNFKKNTTNYQTRYYNTTTNTVDTFTIYIDSTSVFQNGSYDFTIQHLSSDIGFDGDPNKTIEVFSGVGRRGQGGLTLNFTEPMIHEYNNVTKLRCFNNYGYNYSFVNYSCDSTWMSTGINEVTYQELLVYPNPSHGIINILNKNLNGSSFQIFDLRGRVISNGRLQNNQIKVSEPGIYFLKVFNKGAEYFCKVVIY